MEIYPEVDIKKKLAEIKNMKFIKSLRKSDTGIGFTLETKMGIKENNLRNHDFTYQGKLVEAKAQRKGTSSMLTLFTKEPCIRKLRDPQLIQKYGYQDKKGRPALKDTCVYGQLNGHNLGLSVDMKKGTVNMIDDTKEIVWQWMPDDIKLKFINLLLVFADREKRSDGEYFHYNTAYYLQNFKEKRFLELIKEKKIVVDLRMHLKPNGAPRNHGTGFRTKYLDELMNCFERKEQII